MKEYRVSRIDDIDIDIVDPIWESVPSGVLLKNEDGAPADINTEFRLAYTGDSDLYFMFDCEDESPKATMTAYNDPIYDEETVEFFFATECNKRDYVELEWNYLGAQFCANIDNDLNGHTKINFVEKSPITSKVIKKDGGFYVVGKIDSSLFKGEMDTWLFNAYRIKRREDDSMKLYAYSPTYIEQFHRPDYFVKLVFVK